MLVGVMLVGVMLARIVDERKKLRKEPIGVLHYVLYSNLQVFKDVVSGGNPGCGTQGFPAAPGWDLPTGLGVLDYQKLLELYLSLPYESVAKGDKCIVTTRFCLMLIILCK